MVNASFISADMIFPKLKAGNSREVITALGDKLFSLGYVNEDYASAVIKREGVFPTGLALEGKINIAIPHTDTIYVNTPAIAVASLENPVIFKDMGDPNNEVEVSLVFLLAVKNPQDQVILLQRLVEMFQDAELIEKVCRLNAAVEIEKILKNQLEILEV